MVLCYFYTSRHFSNMFFCFWFVLLFPAPRFEVSVCRWLCCEASGTEQQQWPGGHRGVEIASNIHTKMVNEAVVVVAMFAVRKGREIPIKRQFGWWLKVYGASCDWRIPRGTPNIHPFPFPPPLHSAMHSGPQFVHRSRRAIFTARSFNLCSGSGRL